MKYYLISLAFISCFSALKAQTEVADRRLGWQITAVVGQRWNLAGNVDVLVPSSDSLNFPTADRRRVFRFPRYIYVTDSGDSVQYYQNIFSAGSGDGLGYARQYSYELRFNRLWRGGVEYSFGLQYRRKESGWDGGNPIREEGNSQGYSVIDQVVNGVGLTSTAGYVFLRNRRLRPYAALQVRMLGERTRVVQFHYVLPQYGETVSFPSTNVQTNQVIFVFELEPLLGLTYDLSNALAVGVETRLLPIGRGGQYVGVQARYRLGGTELAE